MSLMNSKRVFVAIIAGALLGVLCIVGAGSRIGFTGNWNFLFAVWYNRVIMGLVIGLAGGLKFIKSDRNKYVRGLVLGILVTLAVSLSTGFRDVPSFFAGVAYGVIIDYVATRYDE